MNPEWQAFLKQQGAQLHDDVVQNFGDLPAELLATRDNTVLCDLSQFATLKVTGTEAQSFLQNLLSNDINAVNQKTAQLSSFNSPKGRMLANFVIWQSGADYFLQLPDSLASAMLKNLSMYIMRSKVKISDVSDEVVCLGLAGRDAAELLKKQLGALPEEDWQVAQLEHTCMLRIASNRFQIITSAQQAITLWRNLATSARPTGSSCWDWLNIRAGIPVITPATQEQFVLQMTNLDILGGVSFKKGCYPGQEIVARTHYLGKQKRRMYLAHVESDSTPVAGSALFNEEMAEQACGQVINATHAPNGGFDLLAVLQISSHDTQRVHLHSQQGEALQFVPLPYSLPSS